MFETYKATGKFGVATIPLAIVGLVLAIAASFVYQLGLYWIPLIYVSFLLTWFFGIGLGMAGAMIVKVGKVRNLAIAVLIGLSLTLAALAGKFYFQYQTMLGEAVTELKADPEFSKLDDGHIRKFVKQNISFKRHIEARVEQGWQIGKPGRNGGLPLTGPFVYLIWLIEFGILIWSAVRMPVAAAREPFSESLGQWASEEEVLMTLPVTNSDMVSQIKAATSVDELLQIPIPKTDESNRFAVYRVNSIEGQEMEDAYLSVDLMTLYIDKDGEQKNEAVPLVKHAIFSSEQRQQLVENAEMLNEAMTEYRRALELEEEQAEAAAEAAADASEAAGGADGHDAEN